MINISTLLYNENFYEKLAFTFAIIRSTPSHLTPKEFTMQLQNIYRRKKNHERIYFEQISSELHSLRKSHSIIIPSQPLESHLNFLQTLLMYSTDMNIEMQTIILETIDRIFDFIQTNLVRIQQLSYQTLFRQAIHLILNYHLIPNIHKHSIQHIERFLRLLFRYMKKQIHAITDVQMLIELIGCHPSYFLLVFQSILMELLLDFDQSTSNSNYMLTLKNILQKLTTNSDRRVVEQILNTDSVREQYHTLLYRCLSTNRKEISLSIDLWNIYGRII